MKRNYDKEMQEQIQRLEGREPLLLHSCCGPCSTAVIERLAEVFAITVFFYNPNIDEEGEYQRRKENQIRYIEQRYGRDGDVKFLEGRYDPERFLCFGEPLSAEAEGGPRCTLCFELRLRETAAVALEKNFKFFATTLTVSPMKDPAVINEIGEGLASEWGVEYLVSDFKKKAGYQRSIQLSKEYGLYRQHFCGCSFSRREME